MKFHLYFLCSIINLIYVSISTAQTCNLGSTTERLNSVQLIISQSESNQEKIKKIFIEPTDITSHSVHFKFSDIKLQPGEIIYFSIPKYLQNKSINSVILGHRQNPSTRKGTSTTSDYDQIPGLTSVQVHSIDHNSSESWRYWNGPASGQKGAKFAEISYSPEIENLYEWPDYGTSAVAGDYSDKKSIRIDAVRIVSSGPDEVVISELAIKFTPENYNDKEEIIWTPNSYFNSTVGGKAHFGGGQNSMGLFPQALVLGSGSSYSYDIPLKEGKKFSSIELLVGDSHPDQIKNSDGGWGTKGWARLSVQLVNNQKYQNLLSYENIPPEGLIVVTAKDCTPQELKNAEIIISTSSDKLYVMGIRITYN
ncbi:MAG: hypothetical protein HUU56_17215 [Bdellovibrionaceae bacterium]|nr:hypothetical protein [Pseudobdellovibrionaceae bacterium]